MNETGNRRKYKNPPIEEALVEFRFVPGQEWDLTIPGKLHQHDAIRNHYPGKPRNRKVLEAAFQTGPDQPPNLAVREGIGRIQLVDEGGSNLISLGVDVLSVNVLRPYPGWERFRLRIEAALKAYNEVAQPKRVSRVGVRYINKIIVPKKSVNLGDYFKCSPPSVPELPRKMAGFMNRVELLYDDSVKIFLTYATIDASEGQSAFLLDLDLVWENSEGKDLDTVMALVEDLHDREGAAFEAIVTDAAREVFDAD